MPVTEYYSARHDHPLVVLHEMNVMYFKHATHSGYTVKPDMFTTVNTMLRRAQLHAGGDFYICLTTSGSLVMVIRKPNRHVSYIGIAETDFWDEFVAAARLVQRVVKKRFIPWRIERVVDPFGLRRLHAFKCMMLIRGVPDDIIYKIIEFYYASRPDNTRDSFWYRHITFVRRVETLSYTEQHAVV